MESNSNHETAHKSGKGAIIAICAGLLLFLLTLILFKVDVTEFAVVTQFGNPIRIIHEPGLQAKLPDPVQSVQRLDKRIQIYSASTIELLTLDKKSVTIDYYGTWRIVDPVLYLKAVKDKTGAEARLLDVFSSSLGIHLGKYDLEQLVNIDTEQLQLSRMLEETIAYAKDKASDYGIEVVDTQIRVLNFPEANKRSVYDRMRAEREQMAQKYRSEGNEQASKIRTDADRERQILLSDAYMRSQQIKGEGDAEAIRIYGEAFQRDPAFYEFVRTLESYEKTIDSNTTIVLPSNAEILRYLSGSN